jgi:hypothetical protein
VTHLEHPSHAVGFRALIIAGVAIAVLALVSIGLRVTAPVASAQANAGTAPPNDITLPQGYRDWMLISVATVGPPLTDIRAKLGNRLAMRVYQGGTPPFPDGAIIARVAWKQVKSEANDHAFRLRSGTEATLTPAALDKLLAGSFVAGPATNVQLMVKDSKKYAATGGWGFAQFTNGNADTGAVLKTCFPCHAPAQASDFVFTHYAP